jgi:GNAT superfamily N-acetyltransferase
LQSWRGRETRCEQLKQRRFGQGLPLVHYTNSLADFDERQLTGFFVGWPNPPTPGTLLQILHGSDHIELAIDEDTVVGFATAITDGVLSAYIPLIEVLPSYQGRGIGTELMRRMLAKLDSLYMIDLTCDDELIPFYSRFGMSAGRSMMFRNYPNQAGQAVSE